MAFAVSTLATLLFIVASSLPEHVYGDEVCESKAIVQYCTSVSSDMAKSGVEGVADIIGAMDSGEEDGQDVAKAIPLIQNADFTKIPNIQTYTQILVDAIIACQSTQVWQSTLESSETRLCDVFSDVYEEKQISLPQNFPQTCP